MLLHAPCSPVLGDVDRPRCNTPRTFFPSSPHLAFSSVDFALRKSCEQSIVGVYRIAILGNNTTSLYSTAPGSQNSDASKAGFYIFHIAPEFLSAAILVSLNVRRVFATGMWGDRRRRDPEPEAKNESQATF